MWEGPDFISYKTVLKRTYGEYSALDKFFSNILEVQDVAIEDIFKEIHQISEDPEDDVKGGVPLMRNIYKFLASLAKNDEDWERIK